MKKVARVNHYHVPITYRQKIKTNEKLVKLKGRVLNVIFSVENEYLNEIINYETKN